MPAKAHRPGLTRTHSRSSSNGSSKLGLNLQITQKDPVQPKADRGKQRNGHAYDYESNGRTTSPFPRTNSTVRVQSREHVPSAAPKRGNPHAATRSHPQNNKSKGGFTLATSSNGSDEEDDWVSSESGAATPNQRPDEGSDDSESVTTPVEHAQQPGIEAVIAAGTTPRVETPVTRPRLPSHVPLPSKPTRTLSASRVPPLDTRPRTPESRPQVITTAIQPSVVPSGARTEPVTPTSPTSPRMRHPHAGRRSARPPSTHSLASSRLEFGQPLRPHPLIRGQSYGHAHLAPLTVTADPARAQLSSSPSPPHRRSDGQLSSSPTSIRTASATDSQTSPDATFSINSFRRLSASSARSVDTVPVQPMTQMSRASHDRTRTLSTISHSSSSAALSSLAHLPSATRPATPHMTAYFPQQNPHVHPESIHVLLPSPYVTPHLTLLVWRNPIRESYDRVMRAKQRKRGG